MSVQLPELGPSLGGRVRLGAELTRMEVAARESLRWGLFTGLLDTLRRPFMFAIRDLRYAQREALR